MLTDSNLERGLAREAATSREWRRGMRDMMHFTERVLTEELGEAKCFLQRALAILDANDEGDVAYCVCDAIERLTGMPSTIEQWYMMTGRDPTGETVSNIG